jgi:hypothetical protein
MKRVVLSAALAAVTVIWGVPGVAAADTVALSSPPGVEAQFEGDTIDLSQGWGAARACAVTAAAVNCYRSEAEMDAALAAAAGASTGSEVGILTVSCSSSLRLYTGTSYSGSVLYLAVRLVAINLSPLGFDNTTSSYRVGACDSDLYSGANLGGSLYPGDTSAGAQAASMVSGWNNIVSSVFLY